MICTENTSFVRVKVDALCMMRILLSTINVKFGFGFVFGFGF